MNEEHHEEMTANQEKMNSNGETVVDSTNEFPESTKEAEITSKRQDKVIGLVIVAIIAALAGYAVIYATSSAVASL